MKCSARSYREGCSPVVRRLLVDEQSPGETFSARQWQGAEVDSKRNPQFGARSDSRRTTSLELAIEADRLFADDHGMTVLIGEIESPMMFHIRLIPRDPNTNSDRHLLRTRSDNTETSSENEQLAVVHLHGIGHQHDRAERGWVERKVGLIHGVDPIGRVRPVGVSR